MLLTGRDLIERSPTATLVIDADRRVVQWNQACAQLTGVPAATMIGTCDTWRPFYPEPRPMLADLIVAGAGATELRRRYGARYRRTLPEGTHEAEDFCPQLPGDGRWIFFRAAPSTARTAG